jgi:hypothetical protein
MTAGWIFVNSFFTFDHQQSTYVPSVHDVFYLDQHYDSVGGPRKGPNRSRIEAPDSGREAAVWLL